MNCQCGKPAEITINAENKRVKFGTETEGCEHMCKKCHKEFQEEMFHYKRHIKATCGR